jgi:sugar phosphate isomerase/epimerase
MDRRQVVAGLAAGLAAAGAGTARSAETDGRVPLGVQFFTFNAFANAMTWDRFSAGMEAARRIGYDGIEFAGVFGHKPEMIRRRAEELGLALRSYHLGNDIVRAFLAPGPMNGPGGIADAQDATYTPIGVVQVCRATLGIARDLGCEYAGLGATGRSNFSSLDNIRRLGEAFNTCAELARQAGLKFFYHNHAVDFQPMGGRIPYEVFMEETDPAVRFEFDTGWAASAGHDPLPIFARYASRIDVVHLRDADAKGATVVPGDGVIDFAKVREAARALKDPIFYMEGNGRPEPEAIAEATRAYAYLHRLGWGTRA